VTLCYKIERLCSRRTQAFKSRTSEEQKNISPMHECYFSLNRKCRNTYFTLIEEQASKEIQLSLSHSLLPNLPRRGLSFEGKLSSLGELVYLINFLPPPLTFIGQGELPRLPWAPPRHQLGGDTWNSGVGGKLVNLP
jgi:hypothetical protein